MLAIQTIEDMHCLDGDLLHHSSFCLLRPFTIFWNGLQLIWWKITPIKPLPVRARRALIKPASYTHHPQPWALSLRLQLVARRQLVLTPPADDSVKDSMDSTAVFAYSTPSLSFEMDFKSFDGKLPPSNHCQWVLLELSSNQHPTPTTLSLGRFRCGCSWLLGGSWFWLLLRMIQWRIQWIQHYYVSHVASAAYSFSCSTGLENLDGHTWGPTWKGSCPRKPSIGWKAPYCSGYILRDTKRSQQWNLPSCWSIRWQFPGGYCLHSIPNKMLAIQTIEDMHCLDGDLLHHSSFCLLRPFTIFWNGLQLIWWKITPLKPLPVGACRTLIKPASYTHHPQPWAPLRLQLVARRQLVLTPPADDSVKDSMDSTLPLESCSISSVQFQLFYRLGKPW